MDPLIETAARALAAGDALAALKRVALRDDAEALALRGMAMAQLGERGRAAALLRDAARMFGTRAPLPRARCLLAEAEIALVSRDLTGPARTLPEVRSMLEALDDRTNAAHAGYLEARRLLLVGQLDRAASTLDDLDVDRLPMASRVGCELVSAGIAMRRIRAAPAHAALKRAALIAQASGIAALVAEVEHAVRVLDAPAARRLGRDGERMLQLDQVEALMDSGTLVVDACRNAIRAGHAVVSIGRRPVLFALARMLAGSWPEDVSRETLLARVFRVRRADASHRARLRVEMGRLRQAIRPLAAVEATARGFVLVPQASGEVVVLAPPVESAHARLLALLSDGEAWSSSALALALGVSARTVQRALAALVATGDVESFGRGSARRWVARTVPGVPTSLLLPVLAPGGIE